MTMPVRELTKATPSQDDGACQASPSRRQTPVRGISMLQVQEYARDPRLAEEVCAATGCEDPAAGALLVEQAALAHPDAPAPNPGSTPSPPTKAANQVRQQLAEIAPEDGLQAMLATQFVTAHNLAMRMFRASQETGGDDLANHPGIRSGMRLSRLSVQLANSIAGQKRGGRQEVVVRREVVTTERDHDGREVVDRRTVEARGGHRQEDGGG